MLAIASFFLKFINVNRARIIMSTIKSISINKPCQQQWERMATAADGRYCAQCCKTVTDFTVMSNVEIVNYFEKNGNVCGRFEVAQLHQLNQGFAGTKWRILEMKKILAAASLIGAVPFFKAEAKPKQATQQHAPKHQKNNYLQVDTTKSFILKAKIIGYDDHLPMAGTSISLGDKTAGAIADINGRFEIEVPSMADSVVISFIGYEKLTMKASDIVAQANEIMLKPDNKNYQVVVVGGAFARRSFPRRVWNRIKRIF
jgi:hypothetical protein